MKRNIFVFTVIFWSSIFSALAFAVKYSPPAYLQEHSGYHDTTSEAITHAPSIRQATHVEGGTSPSSPMEGIPGGASHQSGFSPPNAGLEQDVCPPVGSLVRDETTQQWSGPGGWKTTSPSFLRSVDTFVGAQWVGVSIGEVICIYIKTTRSSFPVMLKRGKLVPAPVSGGLWSEDKGGYMECKANDVHHCPFWIQAPKKEKNVYEQLDFYKGKPVENND